MTKAHCDSNVDCSNVFEKAQAGDGLTSVRISRLIN